MKKVIYDLKNDQNVKYDWAKGTLTYNEKIIYNFKNVKFYDEEGKKTQKSREEDKRRQPYDDTGFRHRF